MTSLLAATLMTSLMAPTLMTFLTAPTLMTFLKAPTLMTFLTAPTLMTFLTAPTLMTFLMAQANFEPTLSCITTLTILKPSYSSHLPAYEDGTDRAFRNVGIQNSDAGELPRRKHTTFTTGESLKSRGKIVILKS
jgi:hypothetical protein